MDFLIAFAGVIATLYLLFEFISNGNVFLMFIGIMSFVIAAVSAMNAFQVLSNKRNTRRRR